MAHKLISRLSMVLILAIILLSACSSVTKLDPTQIPTSGVVSAAHLATQRPIPPSTTVAAHSAEMLPAYWPTNGWRASAPEEQGMDSVMLAKMLDYVKKQNINLHSILVVRNGYMVLEAYFYPFGPDVRQELQSCTKSVTSALVGIAIDKGYIQSPQQHVLDFFSDRKIANLDERKRTMTIENLLTMSAGLQWIFQPASNQDPSTQDSTLQMYESADWMQYVLDRPMADQPGTRYLYSNGTSHLLSALIQQATGKSPLAFAQGNLFKPLGISDVTWPYDPQGVNFGAGALQMTVRDMAKFGYLYLKDGAWDGRQIIPADWVKTSLSPHVKTDRGQDYGYLWWIYPYGAGAEGWGGQYIFVIPDKQMVVVVTSGLADQESGTPKDIVDTLVVSAAKSATPLPANQEGVKSLDSLIEKVGQPELKPVTPLPTIAQQISGKTFSLDPNALDWRSFALHFDQEAALELQIGTNHLTLPVGLDNAYKFTPDAELPLRPFVNGPVEYRLKKFHWTNNSPAGVKGFWRDDDVTFVSTIQVLGKADRVNLVFRFEGDTVTVLINQIFDGYTDRFTGKILDQ